MPDDERIQQLRDEIHRLYLDGRDEHAAEIERLATELSDLMMARPEVVDGTRQE